MEIASDDVRPGLDGDVRLARPGPTREVAARRRAVDEQQVVAGHHDLPDLDGPAIDERLHHHVDELQFLVVVEHVGQPVRLESDAPGQRAVLGVRDEIDQRMDDRGVHGHRAAQVRALGAAVEDEGETSSKTLDHVRMVGSRPPPAHLTRWYFRPTDGARGHRCTDARPGSA